MAPLVSPARSALASRLAAPGTAFDFIDLTLTPTAGQFDLRHRVDRGQPAEGLLAVAIEDLRALAQTTADGSFRPNKAAPNLVNGWRCEVPDVPALEIALEHLYPGALADWWAGLDGTDPAVTFRDFVQRQTGMYRITQLLDDSGAAAVARTGCSPRLCRRARRWTVPGLPTETAETKSDVPCFEPCALLLEFARAAAKLGRETGRPLTLTATEITSLVSALDHCLEHPVAEVREGDVAHPLNPRRIALLRERLAAADPVELAPKD